ncbi:MAG: hypothetical protein ABSE58_07370 [Candidatus Limnocylindrales bacterium]|jgi:hypothetical protein
MAVANSPGASEREGPFEGDREGHSVKDGDGHWVGQADVCGHGVPDAPAVGVWVVAAVPHAPATMIATNAAPAARSFV